MVGGIILDNARNSLRRSAILGSKRYFAANGPNIYNSLFKNKFNCKNGQFSLKEHYQDVKINSPNKGLSRTAAESKAIPSLPLKNMCNVETQFNKRRQLETKTATRLLTNNFAASCHVISFYWHL